MRPLTATSLLLFACICAGAPGQAVAQISNVSGSSDVLAQIGGNADRATKIKEINERKDKYYAECMQLWDPETHMTKKEWAQTCRRITDERTKFLLDQLK